ncbi:unnamed protein product [Protopolystoma xenopodis]|uniref:Ig-like domain-containing protein n=1 Tax=Protopolystoma xenopodis TaxID=117903 RepID=A0A3S4ZX51_9PLAT|nr:unnamed protein product [Protopolystoma xenopodis]
MLVFLSSKLNLATSRVDFQVIRVPQILEPHMLSSNVTVGQPVTLLCKVLANGNLRLAFEFSPTGGRLDGTGFRATSSSSKEKTGSALASHPGDTGTRSSASDALLWRPVDQSGNGITLQETTERNNVKSLFLKIMSK